MIANIFNVPEGSLLRDWFHRAERGEMIQVPTYQVCSCGFKFTDTPTARIWYLTRNKVNTTQVVAVCDECDRYYLEEVR